MTKTFLKSRLFPKKNKIKVKPEMKITKFTLLQNLQAFKQNLL